VKSAVWGVLYAVLMIATVVAVDVTFLRDQAILRLLVNIGIVVAFGAVYLIFMRS